MRESVMKCADSNICEKRETLDVTVLIRRVIGHLHIALTDCLALDTAEVDGLFLGVFTDDLHNREPVSRDQVGIGRVPHRMGRRGRVIQVHSHSLLLRTLAGEGIDSSWLRHIRSAFENLFSALVDSGNTDDKVSIAHSGMFDLDCELISGENHSDKIDIMIVAVDTNEFTINYLKHNSLEHTIRNALSYDSLHIPPSSGTGEHAMRNDIWQGGKGGKVGVHVNGVEVPRDL
jgi:hypothetical protein